MKDTPKPRQIEIFRLLMTSGVPLDINLLKEKLQKSERTIRYDIQDLKRICQEYGIEIGYLTKKGYFIPAAQKPECSALLVQWDSGGKNSFVDDEEEKRFTSLFFYLFVQKGYVTAEKLAEVYLASKSTLTRGLGRLEEYFGNSFILEIRKAQGYRLKGDELTLRKKAVELLAARFQGSYTADDWFLLLPEELKSKISIQNIRDISRSIRQVNGKYNIWISNTAYLNLMSYCMRGMCASRCWKALEKSRKSRRPTRPSFCGSSRRRRRPGRQPGSFRGFRKFFVIMESAPRAIGSRTRF